MLTLLVKIELPVMTDKQAQEARVHLKRSRGRLPLGLRRQLCVDRLCADLGADPKILRRTPMSAVLDIAEDGSLLTIGAPLTLGRDVKDDASPPSLLIFSAFALALVEHKDIGLGHAIRPLSCTFTFV